METDFQPELGHQFNFSADWGDVSCEVQAVKEYKTLEYSWDAGDLRSVVTWTLTPTDQGTRLRMEQAGFRMDQPNYYGGAKIGWPRFFDKMGQVLATLH